MLATLYKDERCQQLSCFNILEKMYLDRLIKRTELTEFETLLQVIIEYYSQGSLKVIISVYPYLQKTPNLSRFYKKLGPSYKKLRCDKFGN